MSQIVINPDLCKGCELCVHACPQQILGMGKKINAKGYFYAEVEEQKRCIGCRLCCITCPDVAIEMHSTAPCTTTSPIERRRRTMAKKLMKGSEAIGEAAIQAGCKLFFGYPITPQNEIPEYMSHRLPQVGGTFVQAESEVAASNMLYGAAGVRRAGHDLVVVPGHLPDDRGDLVHGRQRAAGSDREHHARRARGWAASCPARPTTSRPPRGEATATTASWSWRPGRCRRRRTWFRTAFDLADHYRNPVMILGDGLIGQMMEPVEFHEDRKPIKDLKAKTWAATGYDGSRPRAIINSLFLDPVPWSNTTSNLQAKYDEMVRDEIRYVEYGTEKEYDVLIVAYGTVARVCSTAMEDLAEEGVRAAMIRPVSLFPFPYEAVRKAAEKANAVLVVELSTGQMVEDVRLALMGAKPIHFHGRMGGMLASPEEVMEKIRKMRSGESEEVSHA